MIQVNQAKLKIVFNNICLSTLALFLLFPIYTKAEEDFVIGGPVQILELTVRELEEEGGLLEVTYLPTGYVRIKGRASGRGYEPIVSDGWYEVSNLETLQAFFKSAETALIKNPDGTQIPSFPRTGYNYETIITTPTKTVTFTSDLVKQHTLGIPIFENLKGQTTLRTPQLKVKKRLGDLSWKPSEKK